MKGIGTQSFSITHNKIFLIKNEEDEVIIDTIMIKNVAVNFFKDRGRSEEGEEDLDEEVMECIQKCITDETNARLSVVVSEEEVKNMLWGLGKDKSLGPDGFTRSFFRIIWESIEEEI